MSRFGSRARRATFALTAASLATTLVAMSIPTAEARHRRPRRTTTTVPTTTAPTTTVPTTTALTTTVPTTTALTTLPTTTAPATTLAPPTTRPQDPRYPVSPNPSNWTTTNFEVQFVPVDSTDPTVTGQIAPDWSDNSGWYEADVVYSSTPGNGGGTAQRMNVTAVRENDVQVVHPLDFVSGWSYEAVLFVKGTGEISVTFQQAIEPYARFGSAVVPLTGTWQRVRFTGLINTTSAGLLLISASKPADLSFDDVDVRALKAPDSLVTGTKITADSFGIHEGRLASMALQNPGFEGTGAIPGFGIPTKDNAVISGNLATGWTENSFFADVNVEYAIDNTIVHGGSASQRIQVNTINNAVQFGQYMSAKVPATYRFGAWVRGAKGSTARIEIRESPAPYASLFPSVDSPRIVMTGDWQFVSVEGLVTEQYPSLFYNITFFEPGTYWVDDASLIDVSTGAPPEWIPAPSVGGTMRLWDTLTTWSRLEPQRGVWDFSILDRYVALAESRNQQVLLTLGETPAWATTNRSELTYYGVGAVYAPASIADWRNMVKVITTRYRGRIDAYEIWNEPNDPNFGRIPPAQLAELTKVAAEEIRVIDPAATIVSASPYDTNFLDSYLAAGAGQYVDVIGYHQYADVPEKQLLEELRGVRLIANQFAPGKPIWLTEGGSQGTLANPAQDENVVADALLRWHLVSVASGMSRALWYTWGPAIDISGTTIRGGSWQPNAAFAALTDLQRRLTGRTLTKATADPTTGRWALEFTDASGGVLRATWARGGSAGFEPVTWS